MYRCVILDDEPIIVNALGEMIDWEGFGFSIVLAETQPANVLEYLSTHTVELLITDVSMPGMSGLELLQKCSHLQTKLSTIIISAFSEFDYIHRALQLGVENYLLKPIDRNELTDALRQVAIRLDHSDFYSRIDSLNIFRSNLTERWVRNTLSQNELADKEEFMHINLHGSYYIPVLIHSTPENIDKLYKRIIQQLDIVLCGLPFFENPELLSFVISGNEAESSLMDFYRRNLEDNIPLSVGIGAHSEIYSVHDSYINNKKLLPLLYMHSCLFRFEELHDSCSAIQSIADLKLTFEANSAHVTPLSVCRVCMQAFDINRNPITPYERALLESRPSDLPALRDWLLKLLQSRNGETDAEDVNVLHPCVQYALQIISEQYEYDISIKSIAQKLNMSSTYLGKLFRDNTGFYFNDYLLRERLHHSRDLILHTSMKMRDIASRCGFASQTYFNQCFKNYYGSSPLNYKHKN